MALVAQHLAAKRPAEIGGAGANGAHADEPYGLAAQFGAYKTALVPPVPASLVHLGHVAQQGEHQTHGQLRYRLGGIARGVGDPDALGAGGLQVYMVHPGKGHVNEFEVGTGGDDLAAQRHVGDHKDVGVSGTGDLRLRIVLSGIGMKGVSGFHQGACAGGKDLLGDPQGFQQNNMHR